MEAKLASQRRFYTVVQCKPSSPFEEKVLAAIFMRGKACWGDIREEVLPPGTKQANGTSLGAAVLSALVKSGCLVEVSGSSATAHVPVPASTGAEALVSPTVLDVPGEITLLHATKLLGLKTCPFYREESRHPIPRPKRGPRRWASLDEFHTWLRTGQQKFRSTLAEHAAAYLSRVDSDARRLASPVGRRLSLPVVPTDPEPAPKKGDRVKWRNRGAEGFGTVFWVGPSKSGPGHRVGVNADGQEEALWLDGAQIGPPPAPALRAVSADRPGVSLDPTIVTKESMKFWSVEALIAIEQRLRALEDLASRIAFLEFSEAREMSAGAWVQAQHAALMLSAGHRADVVVTAEDAPLVCTFLLNTVKGSFVHCDGVHLEGNAGFLRVSEEPGGQGRVLPVRVVSSPIQAGLCLYVCPLSAAAKVSFARREGVTEAVIRVY